MPNFSGNLSNEFEEQNSRWCLIMCYVSACSCMSDVIEGMRWLCILPGNRQLERCLGMTYAHQILSKEGKNKDTLNSLYCIAVESLFYTSQSIRKVVDQKIERLTVDRYDVISLVVIHLCTLHTWE